MKIKKERLKVSPQTHTTQSLAGFGEMLSPEHKKVLIKEGHKQLHELKAIRQTVLAFRNELLHYVDGAHPDASVFHIQADEEGNVETSLGTEKPLEKDTLSKKKASDFLNQAFLLQTKQASKEAITQKDRDVTGLDQQFINHGKLFSAYYDEKEHPDIDVSFAHTVANLFAASNTLISTIHKTEDSIKQAMTSKDDDDFLMSETALSTLPIFIKTFTEQVDKSNIVNQSPKDNHSRSLLRLIKTSASKFIDTFRKTFNKSSYYEEKAKSLKQQLLDAKEKVSPEETIENSEGDKEEPPSLSS